MKPLHVCLGFTGLPALLTLLSVTVAFGQTASPPVSVFVNANIGMAQPMPSALDSVATHVDGPDREEVGLRATMKRSPLFDLGGGVIIRNRWIVGMAFDRSAESAPADVNVTLQHPFSHPTLTASRATEDLDRVETGLHISAGYRIPITEAFSLSVFGGPSYLTRRQEVLSDIGVSEPFNTVTRTYSATIDSFETKAVRSSGWGYHVGADGSYFFSRHVGIGAQLRYARATFETENLLQSQVDERTAKDLVDAGGLRFAGGVRFRF